MEYFSQVGSKDFSVFSDAQTVRQKSVIWRCSNCNHWQKLHSDADWEIISKNYAAYGGHRLSYGLEQLVFPEGLPPRPRSYHSFEQCLGDLPKNARLLDYGAGDGAVLKSASKLLPGWKLDAFDISDSYKSEIQAIAGVENFYSNDRNQIEKKKYDLVVLWHTLEHVPSPTDELLLVKEFVRDSGLLFVQVPDVERNPFDMGVYDHVSHFSKTTLIRCAERAGWRVKKDGCTWTHNCLTIIFEMTKLDKAARQKMAAALIFIIFSIFF